MAVPAHGIRPELSDRILAEVSEDEIVSMGCDVVNIPSATGEELRMAEYMRAAFEQMGLAVTWQVVEEGRPNVVARWPDAGRGRTLMFNGHMDTSNTGGEPFLTGIGYKPHAVVKDGFIYGLGIYNMKGALVCYTQAVKALQRAGVRLEGSIIIAVVGEIEKTEWGEYTGRQYRGYGVGTRHLVTQGGLPDMGILGEPRSNMEEGARKAGRDPSSLDLGSVIVGSIHRDSRKGKDGAREMAAMYLANKVQNIRGSADVLLQCAGLTFEELQPIADAMERGGRKAAAPAVTDEILDKVHAIAGTPEECIARIEEYRAAGCTNIMLEIWGDEREEQARLFGEAVLPYFSGK